MEAVPGLFEEAGELFDGWALEAESLTQARFKLLCRLVRCDRSAQLGGGSDHVVVTVHDSCSWRRGPVVSNDTYCILNSSEARPLNHHLSCPTVLPCLEKSSKTSSCHDSAY